MQPNSRPAPTAPPPRCAARCAGRHPFLAIPDPGPVQAPEIQLTAGFPYGIGRVPGLERWRLQVVDLVGGDEVAIAADVTGHSHTAVYIIFRSGYL